MAIDREFIEESGMGFIVNNEAVNADVTNRSIKRTWGNTGFLKDIIDNGLVNRRFTHHTRMEKTADTGEYDSSSLLSSVVVQGTEYVAGEEIKVNGDKCQIDYIDAPGGGSPYTKLWVKGLGTTVTQNSFVEAGVETQSEMCWVPRFGIATGFFGAGFPTHILYLGGFWIDKYEVSKPGATAIGAGSVYNYRAQPVSKHQRVVWSDISFDNAKAVASNRIIDDHQCHMMTGYEWGSLLWLSRLVERTYKGNNDYGKYSGDSGDDAYGIPDLVLGLLLTGGEYKMQKCLSGSKPSWSHNQAEDGIFDLFGNVKEFVDMQIINSLYSHYRRGALQAKLNSGDTVAYIRIDYPFTWPGTGSIVVGSGALLETVTYSAMADKGSSVYQFDLTAPATKTNVVGTHCYQAAAFVIVPNSAYAVLKTTIPHSSPTMQVENATIRKSRTGNAFQIGDVVQIEDEQVGISLVLYNSVTEVWTLTIDRGYGPTVAVAHPANTPLVVLDSSMENVTPATDPYQRGHISGYRTEVSLEPMFMPNGMVATAPYDFLIKLLGTRIAIRGLCWTDNNEEVVQYLNFLEESSYAADDVGFRCVYTPPSSYAEYYKDDYSESSPV